MKLLDISPIIEDRKQKEDLRKLDIQASYALIENCYKFLNMNNLQEVEGLKLHMKQTLKKLKEIK